MSTPMTYEPPNVRMLSGAIKGTSYFAIRILLSNIDGPRCGSMPTVQNSIQSTDWWEDQTIIENSLENLLLVFELLCFFLVQLSVRRQTMENPNVLPHRPVQSTYDARSNISDTHGPEL